MIKHIVMWRLKETAHGVSARQNASEIVKKLESLNGRIPGLLRIEAGINFTEDTDALDVVLYSEFTSREDLENYQKHPLHCEIVPFIKEAVCERHIVDYEK